MEDHSQQVDICGVDGLGSEEVVGLVFDFRIFSRVIDAGDHFW